MSATAGSELTFDTAFGACGLAWGGNGLTRVRVLDSRVPDPLPADLPDFVTLAIERLRDYFAGRRVDFSDVRLDEAGLGAFNIRVYGALRQVRYGQTTTYGALAKAAGAEVGASRAIGMIMGRNPWPIIIPCHRVLASGGKIGGFSAPGGATTKARLLAMEGVALDNGAPTLPGLFE